MGLFQVAIHGDWVPTRFEYIEEINMIKSMTAFAREQKQSEQATLCWEIRSVNQRFFDISFRLPEPFRDMEWQLREVAKEFLTRGKIEVSLRYEANESFAQKIQVNTAVVKELNVALSHVAELMSCELAMDASKILSWPGVLQSSEKEMGEIKESILQDFKSALKQLQESREREGVKLLEFISSRLDEMSHHLENVRRLLPTIMQAQKQKLNERLKELEINCSPERLEQEIALIAQKSDVTEEMDRLGAHIGEVRRVLAHDQGAGRRLDFLAQEMNREANTLGSKSINLSLSQAAIELKVLIEQIREQVQNIE